VSADVEMGEMGEMNLEIEKAQRRREKTKRRREKIQQHRVTWETYLSSIEQRLTYDEQALEAVRNHRGLYGERHWALWRRGCEIMGHPFLFKKRPRGM
jgi:predicted RNA-binding protein with RPS1 domain